MLDAIEERLKVVEQKVLKQMRLGCDLGMAYGSLVLVLDDTLNLLLKVGQTRRGAYVLLDIDDVAESACLAGKLL
jgi:hypothetical protein